ncbi:ornithine cyclodeaminase family protein [Nordella sp. HKS 07]|uniref:ornithine cyclodeaminase family protein n=1 Tax=Nordella sp. HKS 07 TaxID=2712222 RepID=UPI0013E10533|nr:ornithine cyclodeaminase family protein [Nordella sp. HKS 07]QIG46649.1 ornithine cyclodeaminase family protein [Nordella sp. HKS 07]
MDQSTAENPEEADFLILDANAVKSLIDISQSIDIAERALKKTSNGTAIQDIRRVLEFGETGRCLSIMYANVNDLPAFGAKVLSVYPGNFAHGLPSHRGGILLFERQRGRPVALVDGGEATAWRTAAASAAATRALSRAESSTLALLGYGEQAQRHVEAIASVRPIRTIRVWGRDVEKAELFAKTQRKAGFDAKVCESAGQAVSGMDIVCTVTTAQTPILSGQWLTPGTHVNAVGASVPSCQEIDVECLRRARVWVDYMPMALTAAAELIQAVREGIIQETDICGEIGAVFEKKIPGRQSASEITLYRSLGVPAQDIELANFLYEAAARSGTGVRVKFGG